MEPADHATEPDLSISARTGKDYRDDGSFWRPLREAFRFELPTEVLKLIHTYYVDAEFEHALDFEANPLSARTDKQLLLDLQRIRRAADESFNRKCLCGVVGGCCYDEFNHDGDHIGYNVCCSAGEAGWESARYLGLEILPDLENECTQRDMKLIYPLRERQCTDDGAGA